ncbi:MAG TPA: TMEM175 family protein [Chloroflexota bacterium]|nr:TMEM175 family protein [Chloroflexota bacterium]
MADKDTDRTEAFSDGVFAIVITLLVLDLRSPQHEPGQLLPALLQQWPVYLAYFASFLYVGVIWLNHHAVFAHIRHADQGLRLANLGILFTTALLPFPTVVVSDAFRGGNATDIQVAVAVYALIAAAMCASWLVFYSYLAHRHGLLAERGVDAVFFREEHKRAWVGIAGYTVAGILGYAVMPVIGLLVFVALPAFYALTSEGLLSLRARA